MSHESLASLWSTLCEIQDLSACIREAAGQCVLSLSLQQDESAARRDVLLTYALELIAIFDVARTSQNAKLLPHSLQRVTINLEQILSSLTILLRSFRFETWKEDSQSINLSYTIFVIARVIISAVCVVRAVAEEQRPKDAEYLANSARTFASRLSDGREGFRVIDGLCQYLVNELSQPTNDHQRHISRNWRDIYDATPESERSSLVDRLAHRAMNPAVSSSQRIEAIVDVCHMYWECEALLIRNCMPLDQRQGETSVQEDVEAAAAVYQAMEVRFLIQDCLMAAENDYVGDAGFFRLYMLFTPSLKMACVQDVCQCGFKQPQSHRIFDLRPKLQSKMLRSAMQRAYGSSPLATWRSERAETIYHDLDTRLRCLRGPKSVRLESLSTLPVEVPVVASTPGSPPISPPAEEPAEKVLPLRNFDIQQVPPPSASTQSLPNLPLHYRKPSRPPPPSTQSSFQATIIEEGLEAVPQSRIPRSPLTEPESEEIVGTHQSGDTNPETLISTSSKAETESLASPPPLTQTESYKIAIETPKQSMSDAYWQFDKTYPEVAVEVDPDTFSLMSENSIPMTAVSTKTPSARKWGNMLKSKNRPAPFTTPRSRFFASGKHILLWTKYGSAYLDPSNVNGPIFTPVHEPDVVHAAGGTRRFVLISRPPQGYKISIYHIGQVEKVTEWTLPHCPGAIDLSEDDRYLALKYTPLVRLYDLEQGTSADHKLPVHEGSRPGSGNHLVAFSHDSLSFMASTRFQPEKVYSYWSPCIPSPHQNPVTVQSTAPSGHVDDHGLTSLSVSGPNPSSRSPHGFLTTFTEKGNPMVLSMSSQTSHPRPLRDPKELIGTRIHSSALSVDATTGKASACIVNNNNDVFWVTDLFGRETESKKISSLKRPKSLKNEVEVCMSRGDEASCFWVDKGAMAGLYQKIGKSGGKSAPMVFKLDVDPLRSG